MEGSALAAARQAVSSAVTQDKPGVCDTQTMGR